MRKINKWRGLIAALGMLLLPTYWVQVGLTYCTCPDLVDAICSCPGHPFSLVPLPLAIKFLTEYQTSVIAMALIKGFIGSLILAIPLAFLVTSLAAYLRKRTHHL